MEKINFQDGTLVTPAKVIIDGTEHEVVSAEYSGSTPLSSFVLNKLQDNIEEGINNIEALPSRRNSRTSTN